MRTNFYQKATLILFIFVLIAITIWFIPFRGFYYSYKGVQYYTDKEIIFDSLFSNHYKIDLYRTGIIFFLTTIVFGIIFILTSKINNPDFNSTETKAIVKRELRFLIIFVGTLICGNVYCLYKNHQYNKAKTELLSIENQFIEIERNNPDYKHKSAAKEYFYKLMSQNFKLPYGTTKEVLFSKLNQHANEIDWMPIYISMKETFVFWYNINSPSALKDTIINISQPEYNSATKAKIQNLKTEQDSLKVWVATNQYLYRNDFINIISKLGLFGFIILYLSRFFYWGYLKLKTYLY